MQGHQRFGAALEVAKQVRRGHHLFHVRGRAHRSHELRPQRDHGGELRAGARHVHDHVRLGTDKPSYLTKSGGNRIDFTWDGRGNRLSDDDNQWEGPPDYDRRVYTYDARNNLTTVWPGPGLVDT